jgi:hypothetical protein
MSLTVKQLKEFLKGAPEESIVTNEYNEDFVHIVSDGDFLLSTQKPIAICGRSGGYVYPTDVEGYYGYSKDLDENVYKFETLPLENKKGE